MAVATKHPAAVVAGLFTLAAVVYWIAFAYLLRGIHFDDGVSVLAAQSILEHGFPKLPSDFVYHRAYLHHYLLAGSVLVFGVNSLAVMLPSLLFAVGSLVLVYLIASRIVGMRWLGVAVVGALPVLQIFSWYATGPRMYMALVFFTLLGIFLAWRGFIEGEKAYRPLTLIALTLAMLSHELGIMAAMAIGGSVMVILLMERRLLAEVTSALASPTLLVLTAIMGAVAWFVYVFEPGSFRPIVIHDGTPPDRVGLNLSYIFWGMRLRQIEEAFPFALPFVLVGLTSIRLFKQRTQLAYLALVMALGIAILGFVLRDGWGPRVFFFTTPLYTLFAVLGVVALVRTAQAPKRPMAAVALALFIAGLSLSTLLGTFVASGAFDRGTSGARYIVTALSQGLQPTGLAKGGFGLPCGRPKVCDPEVQANYAALKQVIGPDDVVVATKAMHASFHLGRVDAWLTTRLLEGGQFGLYEEPTDEYFGIPLVDTAAKLRSLVQQGNPVWIIVHGSGRRLSPELTEALTTYYDQTDIGSALTVYRGPSNRKTDL